MTYKITKAGWIHPVGSIIDHADIPEGRDAHDLVARGIITPHDGQMPVAMGKDDAAGWKARAEALELENIDLRTASTDAADLVELKELRAKVEQDEAEIEGLRDELSRYEANAVPIETHKNALAEIEGLKTQLAEAKAAPVAPVEPAPAEVAPAEVAPVEAKTDAAKSPAK